MASVELREKPHWNARNKAKRYAVHVDGVLVGHVETMVKSTDRIYGRVRIPGKGRKVWTWTPRRKRKTTPWHTPWSPTRKGAVEALLDEVKRGR